MDISDVETAIPAADAGTSEPGLAAAMQRRLPQMLADLEELICCETPSHDLGAVAAGAELVAAQGVRLLGSEPERLVIDGRTHLRWRFGESPAKVLVLCHQDTVWPVGSLSTHPFRISAEPGGEVLRGPGCFDMKTGVVMTLHALAELGVPDGVTVLVTGDEEIGSLTSRALIESEAAGMRAALVLEASADGGTIKTGRKGVSMYQVHIQGRAAHAGLEPEKGVNAGIELAGQVLAIAGLGDATKGTSVVPTTLAAGTTTNTVPAEATIAVDVRAFTVAEQQRVDSAMRALAPTVPGATVTVTGGPNRPPMDPAGSQDLFAAANRLYQELGFGALEQVSVGGASDGNFTAGIGVPTLDGLGAVGAGAHADHEHVLVAEIPSRTALLAALIAEVLTD